MKYQWLPFLITLGILFGMFHSWMITTPDTINTIGAAITGAAFVEFFYRVLHDMAERKNK